MSLSHQILVATFHKDQEWARYLLRSLRIFSVGWLPPVLSVSTEDFKLFRRIADEEFPETIVTIKDAPKGMGNARAQISYMQADLLCPQADVVQILGSDCFAHDIITPDHYMAEDGKPVMFYNSYAVLNPKETTPLPWQAATSKILQIDIRHEFMRRLPWAIPRALLPPMRAYIEQRHKMTFEKFIYLFVARGNRGLSESNIMGGFAYHLMREVYHWVDLDVLENRVVQQYRWHSPIFQWWSHGGLDRPAEHASDYIGGNTAGKTPRKVMDEVIDHEPLRIKSRLDLPRALQRRKLTGQMVEVGVLFGEYSSHLLANWPGTLHMVDPWKNQEPGVYLDGCNAVNMEEALAKTKAAVEVFGPRAVIHRAFSREAASEFADGSLDCVYIDANHAYEWALEDMQIWWPKIRAGGVMGGHDYYNRADAWQSCGVKRAVQDFCCANRLRFSTTSCTSWWVDKK